MVFLLDLTLTECPLRNRDNFFRNIYFYEGHFILNISKINHGKRQNKSLQVRGLSLVQIQFNLVANSQQC